MKKCLNCNKNIRRSIISNTCPFCAYPQPTWSNKSLLSWWFIAAFMFLLAGVFVSRIFFIIFLLQSFYFFSMLYKRKHGNFKIKQYSPNAAPTRLKVNKSLNSDIDDCTSYDSSYFTNGQNQEFKEFENDLIPIWDNGGYSISFEYSNSRGNTSKREILLDKILINSDNEVYFSGLCFNSHEDRTFKAERIIFPIEYAGEKYSVARFLTQELGLDRDYVKELDF